MAQLVILLPILIVAIAQFVSYSLKKGVKYALLRMSSEILWLIIIGALCEFVLWGVNGVVSEHSWLYLFTVGLIGAMGAALVEIAAWWTDKEIRRKQPFK